MAFKLGFNHIIPAILARILTYLLFFVFVFDYTLFPLPVFAQDELSEGLLEFKLSENNRTMDFIEKNNLSYWDNRVEEYLAENDLSENRIEEYITKNKLNTIDAALFKAQLNAAQKFPRAKSKKVVESGYHEMSAYNSEVAQCDASPCITANGFNVCKHGIEDTIAANFLKFNTKVRIPELFGDRVFIVRDRMNSRYTSRVDIWMKNKKDALQFGIKLAKIEVIE